MRYPQVAGLSLEDLAAHRAVRYRRRQQSSAWLIYDARERAGLPGVADGTVRAGAAEWVRPPRPARCRWRVGEVVTVHGDDGAGAHYSGTERCASIWACPVCSAVIRAERSRDIQQAAETHTQRGGHLVFVTLTLRHREQDDLTATLDQVLSGWRQLTSRVWWKKARTRLGISGYVRAVEVTHGGHGWHPHAHVLLFTDRAWSADERADFADGLLGAWQRIVTGLGGRLPNEHGVRVDQVGGDAQVLARYLTKIQEKSAERRAKVGVEMARLDLKSGRAESVTPFELLDIEGPAARGRWCEYVAATHGRRAITWSRGLRDRLDVGDERTDEEILADTETRTCVITVPGRVYDHRLKNDPARLAEVLHLVELGQIGTAAGLAGGLVLADPVTGEVGYSPPARAG